jgi:quinol monooxygenase YgiN
MLKRLGMVLLVGALMWLPAPAKQASAQGAAGPFVLLVELEIVPAELENYKAAVKEASQTAVREEPGCREHNVVFQKDNPTHIFIFEIYDSAEAFAAHQASAHFQKYRAATANMVKSVKRIDIVPVTLNAKGR